MKRAALVLFGISALAQAETYKGLGAESVSAADVAKFAAPPLPDAVSRRIQALLDIRGASDGLLTRMGDQAFFTSRVTGQYQVWRQNEPMGLAVQVTGGEDRTEVKDIAPNDSFVVVSRDVGGQENPGIYSLPLAGGALTVIQHTPKVQTFLEYIADDSKSLYFRANDIAADSFALYRWDVATQKKEKVFDQAGLWSIADHKGTEWILVKTIGNTVNEVYTYDLTSKTLTPLIGVGKNQEYHVRFGAKPDQFLVRTNEPSEYFRIYELKRGGTELKPITAETKFDVEEFSIDDVRLRIYVRTNEAGYAKTKVLDAKSFKELKLPKLPDADHIRVTSIAHGGRFINIALDGAQMPGQSLVYDWQKKKLDTWRVPMTPEVDVTKFADATLESYPARDGTAIPMFVRRPASCPAAGAKTGTPCPVLVEFHGGPESQTRAGFSEKAQAFVDAGFIVVQPNVRGSSGYGKKWLHADDAARRLDVITDIEDASVYIKKTWTAGGKVPKLGVMGGSYGGYSVLMAMTYFAGAYDAGVQSVGISNLKTFLLNTAPYRRALRVSEYGDPTKDEAALAKLSPITHVAKLKSPLLSIQGVNDPRVPVGEAMQFYKEAERRKIPGGLILFPDEGHGVAKRANQVLAIGHTLAFFEKHLK
jgi:dipeptidyl aminopeptidase/acylaminoacyl peptidase